MILRTPMYYKSFHCIADKCKDSCCSAGWEIDIDSETEKFYLNVEGDFGNKLSDNIIKDVNSSENKKAFFKLDENNNAHFKLDKNNNCPFLNKQKLCDIYINLGEEHLCQICKDHPRFYEWFNDSKEAGIGLCCEEAARIILSQTENFSYLEEQINNEATEYDYSTDLYNYLFSARDTIIAYLNKSDKSIQSKLCNVLWYAHTLQQNIDNYLLDDEEIFDVNSNISADIKPIITYISRLESNDEAWPDYLRKCSKLCNKYASELHNFEAENSQIENYLKNISIYFVWRYFLKGVFDEEILSKIKLMYVSCHVIKYLFFCKWMETNTLSLEDCINIVKKYSEEVEYCEENLDRFANDSYDEDFLETNYLLEI